MAKMISPEELAEVVMKLLTDPASVGEDMTREAYSSFMTAVAQAVCDHCGGEINNPAQSDFHPDDKAPDGEKEVWLIGIHGNDSLPADGGVWKSCDESGELFDVEEEPADAPQGA